jgi:predicted aspartyl protease
MKFPYRVDLARSPETGEPELLLRPVVPIHIVGQRRSGTYWALVDTGSDKTVFPQSLATDLGIELSDGRGPGLTAYGGQNLTVKFGTVEVSLSQENESVRWMLKAQFVECTSSDEEVILLGHDGFLEFFVATFDGMQAEVMLVPTVDFPLLP